MGSSSSSKTASTVTVAQPGKITQPAAMQPSANSGEPSEAQRQAFAQGVDAARKQFEAIVEQERAKVEAVVERAVEDARNEDAATARDRLRTQLDKLEKTLYRQPTSARRCAAQEDLAVECYRANGKDPLVCGPIIDAYYNCTQGVMKDLILRGAAKQ